MECRHCASPLEKPGDYCLVCRERNTAAVVLEAARDRATLTMLAEEDEEAFARDDDPRLGETTVTTTPEDGENEIVELRNFAGLIADEIRRKRPEEVYAGGTRSVIRAVRGKVHYPFYRVDDDDPSRRFSSVGESARSTSSRRRRPRKSEGATRRSSAAARECVRSTRWPTTHT